MARSYAVSLGAIALGLIALRGAINSNDLSSVVTLGLIGMVVACGVGYIIGAIADQVICQTVEARFRQRLAEVIEHFNKMEADKQNSRTS
ncbi:hypothetical protein Poly24_09620 [Rosistilla carotiformis]|uniref:Uncharacterized protein n=1 Tax=Rosistilla carotiformis TaxID=2528017 RepID=A0A518JNZ5_9BACT|nr:hypothetical protein [Rosistilla carotiformis]QDV67269.1 hypothetical protein Poly24_09620 [Rosistilla carotiformis]